MIPRTIPGLLAALALIAAAGCSDYVLERPDHTDVFFQDPPNAVDILLVVDNSCSMGDEQAKLAEGFEEFVEYFEFADVDYHIGVVTTDTDNPGQSGRLQGSPSFITPDTPDRDAVFSASVRVGTMGSGSERGLDAARKALGEEMRNGDNAGFIRDDADLSLIFVSDEEDYSIDPVAHYINFFWSLKGDRDRLAFDASALVGVDDSLEPADCGQDPLDPLVGATAAHRYHDVARQTAGVVRSICEEDFTPIITDLGLNTSRLTDRFELTRSPDVDSIEVEITPEGEDEAIFVESDHEDWPWDHESTEDEEGTHHWLVFTDGFPPVRAKIVVRYDLGQGDDDADGDDDDDAGDDDDQ